MRARETGTTHIGANKGASTNSVARNCHNNRNCVNRGQYRDLKITSTFFILTPGEFIRLLLIKDHSYRYERIDFKSPEISM